MPRIFLLFWLLLIANLADSATFAQSCGTSDEITPGNQTTYGRC